MKEILYTLLIGLVIYAGFKSFAGKEDKWQLTYFSTTTGATVVGGVYDTRESCREALNSAKRSQAADRPECGSNCEPSGIGDLYRCDETFEF